MAGDKVVINGRIEMRLHPMPGRQECPDRVFIKMSAQKGPRQRAAASRVPVGGAGYPRRRH